VNTRNTEREYTIPIIDVKYPPYAGFHTSDPESHDFALLVLKEPVEWSATVGSVCLPEPHEEFHNRVAFASGWGRIGPPEISTRQSPELRIVDLVVRKVFSINPFESLLPLFSTILL